MVLYLKIEEKMVTCLYFGGSVAKVGLEEKNKLD